jgi:hypothetical protein
MGGDTTIRIVGGAVKLCMLCGLQNLGSELL